MMLEEGSVTLDEIRKALAKTCTFRGEALDGLPVLPHPDGPHARPANAALQRRVQDPVGLQTRKPSEFDIRRAVRGL
jgi:hypothetical protein